MRRAPRSVQEEATLRNLATGYAVLGIDLASLLLNKAVVLPRPVKDEEETNNNDDDDDGHKDGEESIDPLEEGHYKRTHPRQVKSPRTGPQNAQQQQQQVQGKGVAGNGVGSGLGTVSSLSKPYSERRVKVRGGRGRATAQGMKGESDGEGMKIEHYTSCLLDPCHVSDPLLHLDMLPQHLQPAARLAIRETRTTQRHSASEFTVPDYFKNARLFSAFYRYY